MAENEITEFDEVDPLELHLVSTAATNFSALVAKSTKKGKKMKKSKIQKQLKALRKQAQQYPSLSSPKLNGINLAGAGSAIGQPGAAARVVSAFLNGLEDRVTKGRDDVATAGSAMETDRARQGLRIAMRQRLLGKLVIKTGIEANGPQPLQGLGRPVFAEGSTYNLPDDDGLGYTGRQGEAVR